MGFEKNCLIPSIIAGVLGACFLGTLIGVIVLAVQAGQKNESSSSYTPPEPVKPIIFKEYTAKTRSITCYGPHCFTDGFETFRYSFGAGKFSFETVDENDKVVSRIFSEKADESLTFCSMVGNHGNCYTRTSPDSNVFFSTEGMELVKKDVSCYDLFPLLEQLLPNRKLDKCDYYIEMAVGSPESDEDAIDQVILESDTGYPVFAAGTTFKNEEKSFTIFDSFKPKKPSDESSLKPFAGVTVYDIRNGEGDCSEEPTFSTRETPDPKIQQLFKRNPRRNTPKAILEDEMKRLPKYDSSHIRQTVLRDPRDIPNVFDARTAWSNCSEIIGTITSQNPCGSCWAMSSSAVLADRMCIANGVKQLLSPQYMMFCGEHTGGCNGGASAIPPWEQLVNNGTVSEDCIPYSAREGECPLMCKNETPITKDMKTHAKSYTIPWGSTAETRVQAIQNEIMTNGPVQAAFQVFSDFQMYWQSNGSIYHRTKKAVWKGGHAVRIIGWGNTPDGIDYWLVANSWGTTWGEEGGVFRIRRGNNECNFEEQVIAGLVN